MRHTYVNKWIWDRSLSILLVYFLYGFYNEVCVPIWILLNARKETNCKHRFKVLVYMLSHPRLSVPSLEMTIE